MVTLFFLAFALIGLNQILCFDLEAKTFSYEYSAPLIRRREERHRLDEMEDLRIGYSSWSDGPSYFQLTLTLNSGKKLSFGEFEEEARAEDVLSLLRPG